MFQVAPLRPASSFNYFIYNLHSAPHQLLTNLFGAPHFIYIYNLAIYLRASSGAPVYYPEDPASQGAEWTGIQGPHF